MLTPYPKVPRKRNSKISRAIRAAVREQARILQTQQRASSHTKSETIEQPHLYPPKGAAIEAERTKPIEDIHPPNNRLVVFKSSSQNQEEEFILNVLEVEFIDS